MQDEVNENEIDAIIDDLLDIEEEVVSLREKEMKEISSLLTTEEFGRYLIFDERFKRKMHEVIMEKSAGEFEGMPEGGPPGGGFGPEGGPGGEFCPKGGPRERLGADDDEAYYMQSFDDIFM